MAIPFYLYYNLYHFYLYLLFVLCFIGLGTLVCDRISKELNIHDHPGIVIDEFAGFFITMIYAPHGWIWYY